LVDAGCLASCWSGAGPTLLGLTRAADLAAVTGRAEAALGASGVRGRVLTLRPDRQGLAYGEDAEVPL
jgi:homoserine kinase